jgi:hypothetical protein
MKIIEALKQVKANRKKIQDLQLKVRNNCAILNTESSAYKDLDKQVKGWLQSIQDLSRDTMELLVRIQKTNIVTPVTIELGGKAITRTISEWVYRRREFAQIEATTYRLLTDRGLKEGTVTNSLGEKVDQKIIRLFDAEERDRKVALFDEEPMVIDARLEVVNAVTDLVEA